MRLVQSTDEWLDKVNAGRGNIMPKGKRGPRPDVVTRKAKQDELPGVSVGSRKIAEIEDLAEKLEEAQSSFNRAKEAKEDAELNLVASMKRHKKNFYSRSTWGKVTVKDGKTKASFKPEKSTPEEGSAQSKPPLNAPPVGP